MVKDIHNSSIAQLIHKQKPNLLPPVFHNYFRINTDVHKHNTRNSNKLFIERKRSEQGKLLLNHMGSTIWNHLPDSIVTLNKLSIFKSKLIYFYKNKM